MIGAPRASPGLKGCNYVHPKYRPSIPEYSQSIGRSRTVRPRNDAPHGLFRNDAPHGAKEATGLELESQRGQLTRILEKQGQRWKAIHFLRRPTPPIQKTGGRRGQGASQPRGPDWKMAHLARPPALGSRITVLLPPPAAMGWRRSPLPQGETS